MLVALIWWSLIKVFLYCNGQIVEGAKTQTFSPFSTALLHTFNFPHRVVIIFGDWRFFYECSSGKIL
jgi:hypothetical protein